MNTQDQDAVGSAENIVIERTLWSRAEGLMRRWFRIVGWAFAMAIVTGMITYLRPREYRATAIFAVQEAASTQTGLLQLAAQAGLAPTAGTTESPQFYADLLGSAELMQTVVTVEYRSSKVMDFEGSLIEYYHASGQTTEEKILDAIERLRGDITITLNRLTGVIALKVDLHAPELSAQVARRFIDRLNDYNVNRRQSQARAEREFLEVRVAAAQRELAAAEDSLVAFYANNRLFADSPELTSQAARLQRRVQMLQQIYLSLSQGFENAKIGEVRTTPVINVLQDPVLLVETKGRGTIRNSIVAGFLGLVLVAGITLLSDEMAYARSAGRQDLRSFLATTAELLSRLNLRRSGTR